MMHQVTYFNQYLQELGESCKDKILVKYDKNNFDYYSELSGVVEK
jgi:hypothetical protein